MKELASVASFLRKLFDKLSPPKAPPPRELFLAAFGKHPGWDDHVELGLDTERLTVVKRILYSEGIGGNIESGAWDKLKENQRLPGFDHVFVWRAEDSIVTGRMWSSRDGKGRGRYPMIVCAQSGMILPWVVKTVLPCLEQVQRKIIETQTAADVTKILNDARTALRAEAVTAKTIFSSRPTRNRKARKSDNQETNDGEDTGLPIILYHLERELGSGELPLGNDAPRVEAHRTAHLRVPTIGSFPAGGAVPWINFLSNFVTDETSVLAIAPKDGEWIDLIIGEPGPAHLMCLLASPAAIPLTTEIPYQLDESFISRARNFVRTRRPSDASAAART
jgi:hypothetical protein